MNINNKTLIALGFMLFILVILFEPILFGGKTFGSPDSLMPKSVGIALNKLAEETDELPQWQPWVFSGMPSIHSFQNISEYYFPHLLMKVLD